MPMLQKTILADPIFDQTREAQPKGWVSAAQADRLPATAGAYLLAIRLNGSVSLPVRRLGEPVLPAGDYIYAGSAFGPGGIRARVARHFRKAKSVHWHIDHLTTAASNPVALPVPGGSECDLVSELTSHCTWRVAVVGFGSSDCRQCAGHLLVRD